MRIVKQDRPLMIGLPAERPVPERVPLGSMFFATDTNEIFIAVDGQWHSQNRPIPEFLPMNVQRRFKYVCRGTYPGHEHEHDTYDFFWDGVRNVADRKSLEIASMFDELQSGMKRCSKCGNNLQGGEIHQARVPDYDPPQERRIDSILEKLDSIERGSRGVMEKLESIERRLDRVEGKLAMTETAPTIEDYIAFLRNNLGQISVDETYIRDYMQRALRHGIEELDFIQNEETKAFAVKVVEAARPKTLLEKLKAKMAEQNATATTLANTQLTPEEKEKLRQTVAPALGSTPRQNAMAANFGFAPPAPEERAKIVEDLLKAVAPTLGAEEIERLRKIVSPAFAEARSMTEEEIAEVVAVLRTPTNGTPMTEESKIKKLGKTLKSDAGDAAWRVGAAQATRTAKTAVVAGVLKTIPKSERALRKQLTAFFDTQYGDAVVGLLIASAISMTGAPEGSKRERLSKELRVGAMSVAANEALNSFLDPLRGFMMGGLDSILEGLPEVPKVRVDATEEGEGEEIERSGERAKASA